SAFIVEEIVVAGERTRVIPARPQDTVGGVDADDQEVPAGLLVGNGVSHFGDVTDRPGTVAAAVAIAIRLRDELGQLGSLTRHAYRVQPVTPLPLHVSERVEHEHP